MSLWDYKDENDFKEKCGYEIDGAWYPRVTKIIDIKSKPALYFYYGEATSYKAAQDSTKKAAEEGTMIHEISEAILLGKNPEVPPVIKPAISAFIDYLERNNIQTSPELVERRICNKDERYAGTIDAMVLMDGKFGVMDIKTSQGIYRDYNLQTSAYMASLSKEFKNLQTRWIMRIDQIHTCLNCPTTMRPKGDRKKVRKPWPRKGSVCADDTHEWGELKGIIEVKEFPNWQNDFDAFLGAKKLWEWENENWLKKVKYI